MKTIILRALLMGLGGLLLFGCKCDSERKTDDLLVEGEKLLPYEDPFAGESYDPNDFLEKIQGTWTSEEHHFSMIVSKEGVKFSSNKNAPKHLALMDKKSSLLNFNLSFISNGFHYVMTIFPENGESMKMTIKDLERGSLLEGVTLNKER